MRALLTVGLLGMAIGCTPVTNGGRRGPLDSWRRLGGSPWADGEYGVLLVADAGEDPAAVACASTRRFTERINLETGFGR